MFSKNVKNYNSNSFTTWWYIAGGNIILREHKAMTYKYFLVKNKDKLERF